MSTPPEECPLLSAGKLVSFVLAAAMITLRAELALLGVQAVRQGVHQLAAATSSQHCFVNWPVQTDRQSCLLPERMDLSYSCCHVITSVLLVVCTAVNVVIDHVSAAEMSARHISELRRERVKDPDLALLAALSQAAGETFRWGSLV